VNFISLSFISERELGGSVSEIFFPDPVKNFGSDQIRGTTLLGLAQAVYSRYLVLII
jgi:hypothetical protein